MPNPLDTLLWRKIGASYAPWQGVSVYIYESGTTTQVGLEDESANVIAQPLTTNNLGQVTSDGLTESGANRVYITGGSQIIDARLVVTADSIDTTIEDRSIGLGTLTLVYDASGTGAVAGASTYATLKQEVAEYIAAPVGGRGPTLAGKAINEALNYGNLRNWWFFESIANIPLVTAQTRYNLPTRFGCHISAVLLNAAGTDVHRNVIYMPFDDFFRGHLETNPHTGEATVLTVDEQNSQIILDRTPTAQENGRTLRFAYYRLFNNLSAPGDTLGVPPQAEDWVKQEAIWRVRRLAGDDWQGDRRVAQDAEQRLLARVRSIDTGMYGF